MPGTRGGSARSPRRGAAGARSAGRERRGILETLAFDVGPRRAAAPPPKARLVDLAADWLGLIVALKGAQGLADPAGLRAQALEHKSRFEQAAREKSFAAADTEAATYALVAFLDETVLNAAGAAREAWISRPLQLELFGSNVAGEEFYARLDLLRRERESRIEALEVYYCCLAFGFGGRLRLGSPEKLQALIGEVGRDVTAVRGAGAGPLAPHAARGEELAGAVAAGVPAWLSLVVFVPAILLTFLLVKLFAHLGAAGAARAIRDLLAH